MAARDSLPRAEKAEFLPSSFFVVFRCPLRSACVKEAPAQGGLSKGRWVTLRLVKASYCYMDSLKLVQALDHGELGDHHTHGVGLHDAHHFGHVEHQQHLSGHESANQSMELLPIPNLEQSVNNSLEQVSLDQSVNNSLDHSLSASIEEEEQDEEDEEGGQEKASRKRQRQEEGSLDEDGEFSQSAEERAVKRRTRLNDSAGGASPGPGKDKFDERLKDLLVFKEKFGHCRVPQVWKENKKLGQWVASMRNLKKAGKLPEERQKMLEGLGFVWCCRNVSSHKGGEKRKMVPWLERFEELKLFKDKYGHCNVPHKWKENIKLSNWMYCQRSFHRHGKLSKEKIKKLESIGFEWSKQDPIQKRRKDVRLPDFFVLLFFTSRYEKSNFLTFFFVYLFAEFVGGGAGGAGLAAFGAGDAHGRGGAFGGGAGQASRRGRACRGRSGGRGDGVGGGGWGAQRRQ